MTKKALKVRDVSKDHFSSGVAASVPYSRIAVRIIECKQLLASDLETGKSDPVCFVWCGPATENPTIEDLTSGQHGLEGDDLIHGPPSPTDPIDSDDQQKQNVLMTSVCYCTTDPVWDEEIVFPIDPHDILSLAKLKLIIYVRDEDKDEHENITYDELGQLQIPLMDVISRGKATQESIVLPSSWFVLDKAPGMRRVDGQIKLTISIKLGSTEHAVIQQQLPPVEPTLLQTRTLGIGQLLQSALLQNSDTESTRPRSAQSPGRLSTSLQGRSVMSLLSNASAGTGSAAGRPNSASRRRAASKSQSKSSRVGSLLRLSSARSPSPAGRDDISVLSEEREGAEEESHKDDDELLVLPKDKETLLKSQQAQTAMTQSAKSGSKQFANATAEDDLFSFAPERILRTDISVTSSERRKAQPPPPQHNIIANQEVPSVSAQSAPVAEAGVSLGDRLQAMAAKSAPIPQSLGEPVDAVPSLPRLSKTTGDVHISPRAMQAAVDTTPPKTLSLAATAPVSNAHRYANADAEEADERGNEAYATESLQIKQNAPQDSPLPLTRQRGTEDNVLADGPMPADQLLQPEQSEDFESSFTDSQPPPPFASLQVSNRHIDQYRAPPMKNNALLVSDAGDDSAASGNGLAAVRAIHYELQWQREFLQKNLMDLAKSTVNGFSKVSVRLQKLEAEVHSQQPLAKHVESEAVLTLPEADHMLPGEQDEDEDNRANKDKRSTSAGRTRRGASPSRRSNAATNEIPANGKTASQVRSSKLRDHINRTRRTQQQQHIRENIYTPSFGGETREPEMQFVFRGAKGNIAQAAFTPQPALEDPLQMPPMGGDQVLPPAIRSSSFAPPLNTLPAYAVNNTNATAMANANAGATFAFPAPDSPAKNTLLNKDFCDALDGGTLQDISHLLEASAAKPEQLSVSTRNRLYDVISTLLMRGKDVNRPLIWVTNLLSSPDLFYQLSAHTQRDIIEGLKIVSDFKVNSGVLATLLLKKIRKMER